MFKVNVLHTYTNHVAITSYFNLHDNILFSIRLILEICPLQITNFNAEKTENGNRTIFKFIQFYNYPTNPYVDYANSNFINRTIVRKTVQYGTVFK